MATQYYSTMFLLRRGTEEAWERNNPILQNGEPGWAYDKRILKIGDGQHSWNELQSIAQDMAYVTPQMFGAKGDGLTDDTEALQESFDIGLPVRIPSGKYLIKDKLYTRPRSDIRGEGQSTILMGNSQEDLIMLAFSVRFSDLKIELCNYDSSRPFTGYVFKMNEVSLSESWPTYTGDIRTYVDNIQIEGNSKLKTDTHASCFETSLLKPWGDQEHAAQNQYRYGIYGLKVSNINAMFSVDAKMGYFYRSYVSSKNYDTNSSVKTCWITSISFSDCGMIGPRWCFFMGRRDDAMFEDEYIGMCSLTAYNVYHQKTDENCVGFLFQREKTRVSLYGCEPWDWNQHGDKSTYYPYVIDRGLCGDANTYWLDNNRGNIQHYKMSFYSPKSVFLRGSGASSSPKAVVLIFS